MISKAYSLLDVKVGTWSPPFFLLHDALAVRAVLELSMDVNTTVGKYPTDFVLYRVGEFDDNVGVMLGTSHEMLGNVAALLTRQARPAQMEGDER